MTLGLVMHLLQAGCAAFVGLLIGSFINVVAYRLPQMLQRQWESQEDHANHAVPPGLNLLTPRSHCTQCKHPLAWYNNVPLLSYLVLGGRCAYCKARVSWRYPGVELLTGLLFFWGIWHWGFGAQALIWCALSATLLALALIDADTHLLPDDITLPLLWAGLLLASTQLNPGVDLTAAVWGASAGYLFLWLIYWAFKLLTGKEGMGRGDFKLLAALGAWLGWPALLPIVFLASAAGALVGLALKFMGRLNAQGQVPFGPFLAGAGLFVMAWGTQPMLALWAW